MASDRELRKKVADPRRLPHIRRQRVDDIADVRGRRRRHLWARTGGAHVTFRRARVRSEEAQAFARLESGEGEALPVRRAVVDQESVRPARDNHDTHGREPELSGVRPRRTCGRRGRVRRIPRRRGAASARTGREAAPDSRRDEDHHGKASRADRSFRPHYVTVTRTAVDVCAFPATSFTIAVRVCWPFATFFEFQLTE